MQQGPDNLAVNSPHSAGTSAKPAEFCRAEVGWFRHPCGCEKESAHVVLKGGGYRNNRNRGIPQRRHDSAFRLWHPPPIAKFPTARHQNAIKKVPTRPSRHFFFAERRDFPAFFVAFWRECGIILPILLNWGHMLCVKPKSSVPSVLPPIPRRL